MKDLFGNELTPAEQARLSKDRKTKDRAHAAPPGSGPASESCGTCSHYYRARYHGRTWLKCDIMRAWWTHGPGTDIRASDAACRFWKTARAAGKE